MQLRFILLLYNLPSCYLFQKLGITKTVPFKSNTALLYLIIGFISNYFKYLDCFMTYRADHFPRGLLRENAEDNSQIFLLFIKSMEHNIIQHNFI